MDDEDLDLLTIDCGLVVSPAGCGKTHLIFDAITRNSNPKPILVLTHTNAGVAALRARLSLAGIKPSTYRLSTIDGWAIRLISTFPARAGHDPIIIEGHSPNYSVIRETAYRLLKAGHVDDILEASYSRLLVDEYQDCSIRQHAIIYYAANILPTCVLGDPLQAIFGFGNDPLAKWDEHVCARFPLAGELDRPWRWINAGAEEFGQWLLDVRTNLINGDPIDLTHSPDAVTYVQLDGTANDRQKLMQAGRVNPPGGTGSVLIIGESTSPPSQQRYASQTPGAVTVESVDLRDLVSFARVLNIDAPGALQAIAEFAKKLMTNVGPPQLLRRIGSLTKGTARTDPTAVEQAALKFENERTLRSVLDLLVELNRQPGTRLYRPAVLRSCIRALQICSASEDENFYDAAVRVREQNRLQGRSLPRRAVGSTLLLKGLEAEVSVILDADGLNAKNLYVAMTRGSKQLIICSRNSVLGG